MTGDHMPSDEMSEEEREHLRSLAAEAKRGIAEARSERPEEFGHSTEEEQATIKALEDKIAQMGQEPASGYDIPTPPTPEDVEAGHTHPHDDNRTAVPTAFIVFVDPASGRAIATSEVEETVAKIRIEAEATLIDMRRYLAEALADVNVAIQTQASINGQMQAARQIQEQMATAQMAAGLDLSQMRSRG